MWQRFLLATALVFGLLVGVLATVFGYSNQTSVNVDWSIFQIDGVPLWTVGVVPLAIVLVAGTVYHWFNSLHHFTEHMRHRRRVHELEAEVATLRERLDHVLEMPDHSTSRLPAKHITVEPAPVETTAAELAKQPALLGSGASNGGTSPARKAERRKAEPDVLAKPLPEPVVDPVPGA
jgi:uncharacterized integral membrane protein